MATKTLGYLGNSKLKKIGTALSWTPEMVEEWEKCKLDPIYFTRTYIKIIDVDEGIINFIPYDYQEEIIRVIHENRFTIALTGRQMGKCLIDDTSIKLRNKKTGEIVQSKIGEFFDKIKSNID